MLTLSPAIRILIMLALFGAGLALGHHWGATRVQSAWDLAKARQHAADEQATRQQHDTVADADRATFHWDATWRLVIQDAQLQAPTHLETVTHAIQADTALSPMPLPADVVRVRREQAARSRAIARKAAAAQRGDAAPVQGAGP